MTKPKNSAKKSLTKKQPNRLRKALNWLKPTTPAKGMLLFIIVFAIAGGGYYAYKSSAASYTTYATSLTPIRGAQLIYDDHAKSPTYAVRLNARTDANYTELGTKMFLGQPWSNYPPSTKINTRMCISARSNAAGNGSQANIVFDIDGVYDQTKTTAVNIPAGKSYNTYCSGWLPVGGGTHMSNVNIYNWGYQDVYVSNVSMQW